MGHQNADPQGRGGRETIKESKDGRSGVTVGVLAIAWQPFDTNKQKKGPQPTITQSVNLRPIRKLREKKVPGGGGPYKKNEAEGCKKGGVQINRKKRGFSSGSKKSLTISGKGHKQKGSGHTSANLVRKKSRSKVGSGGAGGRTWKSKYPVKQKSSTLLPWTPAKS